MRKRIAVVCAALAAVVLGGCASFHQTQAVKFVDDDGRFLEVVYGYGDKDHVTTWVSPVNGNEIELSSEYLALEKRLMLNGKAVDTLQIDNVLVAIEM